MLVAAFRLIGRTNDGFAVAAHSYAHVDLASRRIVTEAYVSRSAADGYDASG